MATNKESLIVRLRAACNGLPGAVIAWPHRILHEAAEELAAANARIAELEARCAKAETKAAISQITAETERRLRESAEKDLERECLWSSDGFNDLWESSCGMAWTFPDEGPKENDMTYCPKCRGVLIVDS